MHENAMVCTVSKSSLDEKKLLAVELLATGKSLASIARTLAIDPSTLWRWRQDESFKAALQDRFAAHLSDVSVRVRGMIDPALDVICDRLTDRFERNRYLAAATILRLSGLTKAMRLAADV